MSLRNEQSKFAIMLAQLIVHIYSKGYEVTIGDVWAKTGHIQGSFHYNKLAADLNLFKDGKYLPRSDSHLEFGLFWESIGGSWGGRFRKKDGNHYSLGEGR